MITVTTPVIALSNVPAVDTDPYLVDLPGWYDTAEPKMQVNRRTQGHGAFDQDPVYDDALFFSIVGKVVSPDDPQAVFSLRSTLMGLKSITGLWPVDVSDPDGTTTRYVRISGKVRYTILDEALGWAEFEIPVMAKDPRKYAAEVVASTGLASSGGGIAFPITFPISFGTPGTTGRVETGNSGNAETYTTIEVTGGLAGGFSAICVELGREIRFERAIPLGSTVSVDLRTGQAFIDNQSPVSGFLTRREWWTNPPGTLRTIQFAAIGAVTGTPTLTARTAPASN